MPTIYSSWKVKQAFRLRNGNLMLAFVIECLRVGTKCFILWDSGITSPAKEDSHHHLGREIRRESDLIAGHAVRELSSFDKVAGSCKKSISVQFFIKKKLHRLEAEVEALHPR